MAKGLAKEFAENNNHICRHVATEKNENDIHGRSGRSKLGKWGPKQLDQLASFCIEKGIRAIQFGNTPQCSMTADLICERIGLHREAMNLQPFDMGDFAGMSHLELLTKNKRLGLSLERFRYRVASYSASGLAEFWDPCELSLQNQTWIEQFEKSRPSDTLFVLSSSLIVKVVNALNNIFPDQPNYYNVGVANGSVLNINDWHVQREQWPDTKSLTVNTSIGDITLREYVPKSSFFSNFRVIIYPGVFGSSRFGPYNLFNRIARALADLGLAATVVDPIGSGESLPLFRDIDTEKSSIRAVQEHYSRNEQTVFVAHSLSANLVQRFDDPAINGRVLIAPILDIERRRNQWSGQDGIVSRHGLRFDSNVWQAEHVNLLENDNTSFAIFGTIDAYVDHKLAPYRFKEDRIALVEGAGHNFSEGEVSNSLIKLVSDAIQELYFN